MTFEQTTEQNVETGNTFDMEGTVIGSEQESDYRPDEDGLITIESLMAEYETITTQGNETTKAITDATHLVEDDDIAEKLAEAVVMLDKMSNRGTGKKKWYSKIPFASKYLDGAQEKLKKEQVVSGTVNDGIQSMFDALNTKRESIREVCSTLITLYESLEGSLESLQDQQEKAVLLVAKYEDENDRSKLFKSRNLLTDVGSRIIVINNQLENIDRVINAAEAAITRMSEIMPTLQINLTTEIGISSSVTKLKDVMTMLNEVNTFTKEVSINNDIEIQEAVVDTVGLLINKGDTNRLLELEDKQKKLTTAFNKKIEDSFNEQSKTLDTIINIQNRLDHKQAK